MRLIYERSRKNWGRRVILPGERNWRIEETDLKKQSELWRREPWL